VGNNFFLLLSPLQHARCTRRAKNGADKLLSARCKNTVPPSPDAGTVIVVASVRSVGSHMQKWARCRQRHAVGSGPQRPDLGTPCAKMWLPTAQVTRCVVPRSGSQENELPPIPLVTTN